jgi:uncharacterized membrane protein YhaH (DUF805 family)
MFEALKRYAEFGGRSRRKEYWLFILLYMILSVVATVLDASVFRNMAINGEMGVVSLILSFALIVPLLAVAVRRLHDTDRSGWWILIGLIPLLGQLALLVFYCLDGTPGDNRFGPDPKQS